MAKIHPTAVIDPSAEIADDAVIGPYCVVGPEVIIGAECFLEAHCVLSRRVRLGCKVRVFPFASLHHINQDLKYRGEDSWIEVGDNTVIREHTSIHAGTQGGGMITKIGANNLIMASVHVGHDFHSDDGVIVSPGSVIGGHVRLDREAILSGLVAVHQFVRIGRLAMVSLDRLLGTVPPFALLEREGFAGVNLVGLRRRNYSNAAIQNLQEGYQKLFRNGGEGDDFQTRVETLAQACPDGAEGALLAELIAFLQEPRQRHLEPLLFRERRAV